MKKGTVNIIRGFKTGEELYEFMEAYPKIRRWYLARLYSEKPDESYVDLYYSPISEFGDQVLAELEASDFNSQVTDDFEWWQPENFDQPAHIALADFRKILQEHSSYRPDQPIEEGMVFIEIWREGKMSLIPFSYQAREASKNVYKGLLEKGNLPRNIGEEK
jgi:hypothetical protein